MTEIISIYPSVRETIRKFNMYGKSNGYLTVPIPSTNNSASSSITDLNSISTTTSDLQSDAHKKTPPILTKSPEDNENIESIPVPIYALPTITRNEFQIPIIKTRSNPIQNNADDIGLEIIESRETNDALSTISDYGEHDIDQQQQQQRKDSYSPVSPRLPPLPSVFSLPTSQDDSNRSQKRTLPLSNFLLEIGALVIVFIVCMILVLAIREEQANLRTTMQIVYTYIYLISIIWMVWCTYDIIKFRRQWMKLTSSADNQSQYMYIVENYPHDVPYFPDIHNTGGLFMRVGAGLLCMGSLVITIIELAKTIEVMRTHSDEHQSHITDYSESVYITKSLTYIFRCLFHCVQFTFLFRYGNIVIDRYHFLAKFGLIHIIIANFITWFEAIVIETLEELHKQSTYVTLTTVPITINTTISGATSATINFFKAAEESSSENSTKSVLEFIENIHSTITVYLYPCLIEYSLICVTVFYIMWRNVGKKENRSFLHFGARHVFTINCSRASCGLLLGGVIFLLTILTLLPAYILDLRLAILITHITECVLLFVSLLIVCISFIYTTKLYYNDQTHVDIFDQILILITTVGNFAYSFFDIFASIFIESYAIDIPRSIEIIIGLLAIFQTFLQSAFILDALKRRVITKNEIRNKPGRELVTALLLINLAIWLHDSISAKKVKLNPVQSTYYDPGTWSIVQAFTAPLSIFYRFHSSVCLADIWQEVYHDHRCDRAHNSIKLNNKHNNQH